jgi:hypothetical protein
VPPQERVGLDDEERLSPRADAAGQEHQQYPITRVAAGPLDTAPQDEKLLPQQGILGDQLGPAPLQIGQRPGERDRGGGSRGSQHPLAEARQDGTAGVAHAAQEAGEHGGLLV